MIPMKIGNRAAGLVAIQHSSKGANHGVTSACSNANDAIRDALLLLRQDYADVMVCGASRAWRWCAAMRRAFEDANITPQQIKCLRFRRSQYNHRLPAIPNQ